MKMYTWTSLRQEDKLCQFLIKNQTLYLFFRGSKGIKEWLMNFIPFFSTRIDGVAVDLFDAKQAYSVLPGVLNILSINTSIHKVKIFSLSRGAGAAQCMYLMIRLFRKRTLSPFLSRSSQHKRLIISRPVHYAGKLTIKPWNREIANGENHYVKGDLVPYLPPFHKRYETRLKTDKNGEVIKMKFVAAHTEAARMAARKKNDIAYSV